MTRAAIQRYLGGLSRNTFLLAFASLFADISTEMLYPVLPIFLTQTLKASCSVVGLVDGFAQATQNIVQGFSGALSDKLQKRKAIALAGYFPAAVAKPLMGLSTTWPGVFGARVLDCVGAGTRRDSLIAASASHSVGTRVFPFTPPRLFRCRLELACRKHEVHAVSVLVALEADIKVDVPVYTTVRQKRLVLPFAVTLARRIFDPPTAPLLHDAEGFKFRFDEPAIAVLYRVAFCVETYAIASERDHCAAGKRLTFEHRL
jgi:hypothetical protein